MKKNHILLSLIVATAVSLIVNFSYLLSIWVINDNDSARDEKPRPEIAVAGVVHLAVDGYGYLVVADSTVAHDSIYISSNRARRFGLREGMVITGMAEPSHRPGAHPTLERIETIDGQEFDYSTLFKRPNDTLLAAMQVGFYLLVAFAICLIFTHNVLSRERRAAYFYRLGVGVVVAVVAYMMAPIYDWHAGEIRLNITTYNVFNPMVMMQCSFILVVCALYGLRYAACKVYMVVF